MADTIYILLGSNLGDRETNLKKAVDKISGLEGIETIALSSIYQSKAQGMDEGSPDFLNQAMMADYQYLPNELLDQLEKIENELGRDNKGLNLPRLIDLDILLFGEQIIKNDRLTVPHKELLNRAFALTPVIEISPDIEHPQTGRLLKDHLTENKSEEVTVYKDYVARSF